MLPWPLLHVAIRLRRNKQDMDGIMPLRDEILIYTRMYNGRMQYRRWNATRNYWVDPYWMDINP